MKCCLDSDKFTFFKGRVALYVILRAAGVRPGDHVLTPGFTCVVVPNAIVYHGARPVYVDIDAITLNVDVAELEKTVTKRNGTERVKAMIIQHSFGIPADMEPIRRLAKQHDILLIEDCCHALGSKYMDKPVGSFGDAAFFSSQWSKPISTGLGGWAVVNNPDLKAKVRCLHESFPQPRPGDLFRMRLQYFLHAKIYRPSLFWLLQGIYRSLGRVGLAIGSSSEEELDSQMPKNYALRMSEWHSRLLHNKLESAGSGIRHRKRITSIYEQILGEREGALPKLPDSLEPVFLRYPVRAGNKRELIAKARASRIELGDWFVSPIHPNLSGWEKVGYEKGACPVSEAACGEVVNLPTHELVSEAEACRIAGFVADNMRPPISQRASGGRI